MKKPRAQFSRQSLTNIASLLLAKNQSAIFIFRMYDVSQRSLKNSLIIFIEIDFNVFERIHWTKTKNLIVDSNQIYRETISIS